MAKNNGGLKDPNAQAPLNLLSGQWSSQAIRRNYILKFGGKPPLAKFYNILFCPLGSNCHAAPVVGFKSIHLGWVPVQQEHDGSLTSSASLQKELEHNIAFHNTVLLSPPWWLGSPLGHEGKVHSSIIVRIYGPLGAIFDRLKHGTITMFGRICTVQLFESCPLLLQCSRCLHLGHTIDHCRCDHDLLVCPKCGGPHESFNHAYHCPTSKSHKGARCNCPPLASHAKNAVARV